MLFKHSRGSCGSSPVPKTTIVSTVKAWGLLQRVGRSTTCLLFDLQTLNDGRKLAQNLVSTLVVLHLGGNELGKVA